MKITCTREALAAMPAIVLLCFLLSTGPASAVDYTWDKGGGDNNWSTPANWNPDGTPGAGDNVIFNATSNTACTADNISDNLGSITLAAGYTQTLTLNSNFVGGASNTLTLTGDLTVNSGNILCKGDVTAINAASGGTAENPHGTGIVINAANVTVASGAKIHADSQGFSASAGPGQGNDSDVGAGGGGYGGYGGGCAAPGGIIYGSVTQPTALGSGGGNFGGALGGVGGGAIKINATGTVMIDGTISAKGGNAVGDRSGGGAGGSVWIIADTLAGGSTGAISADGGNSILIHSSGGGAGGRIALDYTVRTYTGTIRASGGTSSSSSYRGHHGTLSIAFDGNDLTVSADIALAPGTYNIPNLLVTNNASLECQADSDGDPVNGSGVIINATNVTIDAGASLSANGQGFRSSEGPGQGNDAADAGGGGYGGYGGSCAAPGGIPYGSVTEPTAIGSGGGNWGGSMGGVGGGAIKINASGTVTINGTVSANGERAYGDRTGGGAGGSVWIIAGTLAGGGTGAVIADGGNSILSHSSGGGAGGRIALDYTVRTYTGTIRASGGTSSSSSYRGHHGTLSIDFDGNDLTVSADIALAPGTYNIPHLAITNNATLECQGDNDGDPVNGSGVTINATDVMVDAGASLSANGQGFRASEGPGAGNDATGAGGGGYGGYGGACGAPGGVIYGSVTEPTALGSGGGDYTGPGQGGVGGGAIKINATGTVTIDGTLSANGKNAPGGRAAGGSGGSIWVIADTLAGGAAGTITADGGNGHLTWDSAGGAGGRIALDYATKTYTGTVRASGGIGRLNQYRGHHGTLSIAFDGNDLTVSADIALAPGTYNIPNLTVTNNATLECQADNDGDPVNGSGVTINATNVTIDAGATLSANGQGFSASEGPGQGNDSGAGAGGGGYGGQGGACAVSGGGIYGSPVQPTALGSGGGDNGGTKGGAGGGALKINVSSTVTVHGTISANGKQGCGGRTAGGSAGSVWIIAGILAGADSGAINAVGGNGHPTWASGGGGGGRIALECGSITYAGTTSVAGGSSGAGGSNGTSGTVAWSPIGGYTDERVIPEAQCVASAGGVVTATFKIKHPGHEINGTQQSPNHTLHNFGYSLDNGVNYTNVVSSGVGIGNYYKEITVDCTKVEDDLSDFPILFSAADPDLRTTGNGGRISSASGYDIVFADSDGNILAHEIDKYDGSTGELVAWVKVPSLSSSTNTVIRMYYGDSDITTSQDNADELWDSYSGVWHLSEDPSGAAPQIQDSAVNGRHGTSAGTMTSDDQVGGVIGGSVDFDGTDDVVQTTLNIDQSGGSPGLTLEAWVYPTSTSAGRHHVISSDNGGADWSLLREGGTWYVFTGENSRSTGASVDSGVWQHVAAVFVPGTGVKFYKNGVETLVPFVAYDAGDNNIAIGKNPGPWAEYFTGMIDEARVSSAVRSAAWIQTSFNNQDSPETFYSVGAEQEVASRVLDGGWAGGNYPAAATLAAASALSFTWNTRHMDMSAPLNAQTVYNARLRFKVKNTVTQSLVSYTVNSKDYVISESFKVNDNDDDDMADAWETLYGVDDPDADPDGDGRNNLAEFTGGTNPISADTDTDSMPDGWETTYGLNPLVNDASLDSDGDGYSNLQEYTSSTEPNNAASKPQPEPEPEPPTYPPRADAGPDQTVKEGETATLNAGNSSDPDGVISSYQWTQSAGTPVVLSNAAAVQPAFTTPDVGPEGVSLTFRLTVTDNSGLQSTDTCIVNVTWQNAPPTANAGPDQTVIEGDTVTLNASSSSDPDDGIASYQWTQSAGTPVTLSSATAIQPTFATSDVGSAGESLIFQLIVTDKGGLQAAGTCTVNVTWQNKPPTANAGPDQTIQEGATVILDASNSSDPDDGIVSYQWTQTAGPPVTLANGTSIQPTFTAPDVGPAGESMSFQLTVTDSGGLQATDACTINVSWQNEAPTANAGADQTVEEGNTVTLNGSNSSDPDDGIAAYQWTQIAGTSVTVSDAGVVQPTFTIPDVCPEGEPLIFRLTVTDKSGLEDTDICIVKVTSSEESATAAGGKICSPVFVSGEGLIEVALENNAPVGQEIVLGVYDELGNPVGISDGTGDLSDAIVKYLEADGKTTFNIRTGGVTVFRGSYVVTSEGNDISGIGITRFNDNRLESIPIMSPSLNSIIPHIIANEWWRTYLAVSNPNEYSNVVVISWYDPNGTLRNTKKVDLAPNQSLYSEIRGLFGQSSMTGKLVINATMPCSAMARYDGSSTNYGIANGFQVAQDHITVSGNVFKASEGIFYTTGGSPYFTLSGTYEVYNGNGSRVNARDGAYSIYTGSDAGSTYLVRNSESLEGKLFRFYPNHALVLSGTSGSHSGDKGQTIQVGYTATEPDRPFQKTQVILYCDGQELGRSDSIEGAFNVTVGDTIKSYKIVAASYLPNGNPIETAETLFTVMPNSAVPPRRPVPETIEQPSSGRFRRGTTSTASAAKTQTMNISTPSSPVSNIASQIRHGGKICSPVFVSGQESIEVALENHGPVGQEITLRVYDESGNRVRINDGAGDLRETITKYIESNGKTSFSIGTGGVAISRGSYCITSRTNDISGIDITRFNDNRLETIPITIPSLNSVIPHIAANESWETYLAVSNPNEYSNVVVISWYDSNGALRDIKRVDLAPNQSFYSDIRGLFGQNSMNGKLAINATMPCSAVARYDGSRTNCGIADGFQVAQDDITVSEDVYKASEGFFYIAGGTPYFTLPGTYEVYDGNGRPVSAADGVYSILTGNDAGSTYFVRNSENLEGKVFHFYPNHALMLSGVSSSYSGKTGERIQVEYNMTEPDRPFQRTQVALYCDGEELSRRDSVNGSFYITVGASDISYEIVAASYLPNGNLIETVEKSFTIQSTDGS